MPQEVEPFFTDHVGHIIARWHACGDNSGNLAFACRGGDSNVCRRGVIRIIMTPQLAARVSGETRAKFAYAFWKESVKEGRGREAAGSRQGLASVVLCRLS
jgi:hypothetical protein